MNSAASLFLNGANFAAKPPKTSKNMNFDNQVMIHYALLQIIFQLINSSACCICQFLMVMCPGLENMPVFAYA